MDKRDFFEMNQTEIAVDSIVSLSYVFEECENTINFPRCFVSGIREKGIDFTKGGITYLGEGEEVTFLSNKKNNFLFYVTLTNGVKEFSKRYETENEAIEARQRLLSLMNCKSNY